MAHDHKTKPNLSVVVCTYKRPDMLRDSLQSLIAQETDGRFTYEIVVVTTKSDDTNQDVIDDMNRRAQVTERR